MDSTWPISSPVAWMLVKMGRKEAEPWSEAAELSEAEDRVVEGDQEYPGGGEGLEVL